MNMAKPVVVSEINITDTRPVVLDKEIAKLLPNTLFPEHISFRLSPVSNAISNAIRRTVECELPTLAMYTEYDDTKTNNEFIIPEMVHKRLRMIPIDQKTSPDAIFSLYAINDTPTVRDVKVSEMKIVSGGSSRPIKKLPFNETYTLCTLEPGKSIKISNIKVQKTFGFVAGDGMSVMAVHATSLAVDQKPINVMDQSSDGIPSRVANPQVWDVAFSTNGTMPAAEIVIMACNNLIERIQSLRDMLYLITNNGDYYEFIIDGESDTIGNLLVRTICDMFPDVDCVTYKTSIFSRSVTIRIRYDDVDIHSVFTGVIHHLSDVFTQIKGHF